MVSFLASPCWLGRISHGTDHRIFHEQFGFQLNAQGLPSVRNEHSEVGEFVISIVADIETQIRIAVATNRTAFEDMLEARYDDGHSARRL